MIEEKIRGIKICTLSFSVLIIVQKTWIYLLLLL
jgi:hypothetical protein